MIVDRLPRDSVVFDPYRGDRAAQVTGPAEFFRRFSALRHEDETTAMLAAWSAGDDAALAALLPRVYAELSSRAARYLRRERPGHTLETGALVNEVYLRLSAQERARWQNREHFMAVSASLMRRVLVDHARSRGSAKRGGARRQLSLDEVATLELAHDPQLVALDDALRELSVVDPELARVVELRYFGGLENAEIAALDGVSERTVIRRWRFAQAWLYRTLGPATPP